MKQSGNIAQEMTYTEHSMSHRGFMYSGIEYKVYFLNLLSV